MLPYLALPRMGVTVPSNVATEAVGSYPTVSPLPSLARFGGLLSVALSVALGLATYSARPLAGILLFGARTFLPVVFKATERLPGGLPGDIVTEWVTSPRMG